jgi:hypothetical protein
MNRTLARKLVLFILTLVGVAALFLLSRNYFKQSSGEQAKSTTTHLTLQCSNSDLGAKEQCLEKLVEQELVQEGPDQALASLAKLSHDDGRLARSCHGLAHLIGKVTYEKSERHQPVQLTSQTSLCAYGFYHGFMEALLHSGTKPAKAGEFCESLGKNLGKLSPNSVNACYHGLGHGLSIIEDPSSWTNEDDLIPKFLGLCREISPDVQKLAICATGIFNAIAIVYYDAKYNYTYDKDTPLKLCDRQEKIFHLPCYTNIAPTILSLNQNDFTRSAKYFEAIPDVDEATSSIKTLSASNFAENGGGLSPQEVLRECHGLKDSYRTPCLEGYVEGMLEFGQTGLSYLSALNFCRAAPLDKVEVRACFTAVLSSLPGYYNPEKLKEICSSLETKLQNQCFKGGQE